MKGRITKQLSEEQSERGMNLAGTLGHQDRLRRMEEAEGCPGEVYNRKRERSLLYVVLGMFCELQDTEPDWLEVMVI